MRSSALSTEPSRAQGALQPLQIFWAAWGAVVLLTQAPLVQMILQDPQSLHLGIWNWGSFFLFLAVTFLFFPLVIGALFYVLARFSPGISWLLLCAAVGFLAVMQINFHFVQVYFMEAAWRRLALLAGLLFVMAFSWRFRNTVLQLLGASAVLSIGVVLLFALQAYPQSGGLAKSESGQVVSSGGGPVFFLTFEKIAAPYVANAQGKILHKHFPNLSRFTAEADYYPNTYANSTATVYALKTLYSGRLQTAQRNWTKSPNLRDLLGKDRKVFMLLDILTGYSRPNIDALIRTIGTGKGRGRDLIVGWYKTYLMTILPDPLEGRLALMGWRFNPWFDLWAREAKSLPPGEKLSRWVGIKQMDKLKELVLEHKGAPHLYIMHSFISDEPGTQTSAFLDRTDKNYAEDLSMTRDNLATFDQELGELIQLLKAQGLYKQSCILVTADTGYDPQARHLKGQEEIPVSPELTRLFLALKRPGQTSGRVFPAVFRQVDVLPTLLSALGIDPLPYRFEGAPLTDPKALSTLRERPVEMAVSSESVGLLYYRLTNPSGPFRRVRR